MKQLSDDTPRSCRACVEVDRAGMIELKDDGYSLGTFQFWDRMNARHRTALLLVPVV